MTYFCFTDDIVGIAKYKQWNEQKLSSKYFTTTKSKLLQLLNNYTSLLYVYSSAAGV